MQRTVHVRDEYRTNKLSLEPGGHQVAVTFKNGKTLVYDKVKNPKAYIKSLSDYGSIVSVTVDGEPLKF
jgi:hypothetical protein